MQARNERSPRPPWRPLLSGADAEPIERVVLDIAEALAAWPIAIESDGTFSGSAAIALFFRYLAASGLSGDAQRHVDRHLDRALEGVARAPLDPSLHGGLGGTAWLLAHLERLGGAGDAGDLRDLDELLIEHTAITPWEGGYDLVGGLVGLGVYALERWPQPSAVVLLEQIVARLDELRSRDEAGLFWHTAPALLLPRTRQQHPDGYANLGVAHGVPGVIGLLARACALGIAPEASRALLGGATAWLMKQGLHGRDACYPTFVGEPEPARSAWCYGDPGVAAVLCWAAREAGEEAWGAHALSLGRRAAARSFERSGVMDAGLCHGAAGLMLIFQRLYVASGDATFHRAAVRWLERTLAYRDPDRGVAGFEAYLPPDAPAWLRASDPGLLTGAAGIGLALLAAIREDEPRWDAVLLLSAPT